MKLEYICELHRKSKGQEVKVENMDFDPAVKPLTSHWHPGILYIHTLQTTSMVVGSFR